MKTILFVCTGNTCRSPMAEGVARQWLEQRQQQASSSERLFVISAGATAPDGAPAAPEALEAMRRVGIDYHGSSTPLTAEMVQKADVVFCMTGSHLQHVHDLIQDMPEQEHQPIICLLDPEGSDLEDPIGLGQHAYDQVMKKLQQIIPERLEQVLAEECSAANQQKEQP